MPKDAHRTTVEGFAATQCSERFNQKKYVAPAPAEGRLVAKPDTSPYLAHALATQRISNRGARTRNRENIDLDISRNQWVVIIGLSGSGNPYDTAEAMLNTTRWPAPPRYRRPCYSACRSVRSA